MLDVVWEPQASDQLAEIIEYIVQRDRAAAERLERQFHDKLEVASKIPRIGRPGRVDGTREIVIHPNYLAIYQVTETAIDVVRILHARQRYP